MVRYAARDALRNGTADWHRRVDRVYSAAEMDDRIAYGEFLSAQAAALLPVEVALDASGIANVVSDWPARRRGSLLVSDLEDLGLAIPFALPLPTFATVAGMMGALYVIEGSRLGGKLLRRSVPDCLPTRFLDGLDAASWPLFLTRLDEVLETAEHRSQSIDSARNIFSLFEASGRLYLDSRLSI